MARMTLLHQLPTAKLTGVTVNTLKQTLQWMITENPKLLHHESLSLKRYNARIGRHFETVVIEIWSCMFSD